MTITESFLVIPHASLAVPLARCVAVGVLFLVGLGIAVAIGETAMDACLTTVLFISFLSTVAMSGGFDVGDPSICGQWLERSLKVFGSEP